MNEKYRAQLKELARQLVTPERFGRVALQELFTPVELQLAFPEQSGDLGV